MKILDAAQRSLEYITGAKHLVPNQLERINPFNPLSGDIRSIDAFNYGRSYQQTYNQATKTALLELGVSAIKFVPGARNLHGRLSKRLDERMKSLSALCQEFSRYETSPSYEEGVNFELARIGRKMFIGAVALGAAYELVRHF